MIIRVQCEITADYRSKHNFVANICLYSLYEYLDQIYHEGEIHSFSGNIIKQYRDLIHICMDAAVYLGSPRRHCHLDGRY